jgi:Protein of unknown function (DUF3099)
MTGSARMRRLAPLWGAFSVDTAENAPRRGVGSAGAGLRMEGAGYAPAGWFGREAVAAGNGTGTGPEQARRDGVPRPEQARRDGVPRPEQAGRDEPGPEPPRADKRRYFVLMGVCIALFVVSWAVVDRYSVLAAVIMSAVALVIPPLAAIVANVASATDRRRP